MAADIADEEVKQYYCNINEPVRMDGDAVSFVDLDLDYVRRDGVWKVVDEDEFLVNAVRFAHLEALIPRARQELSKLQELVKNRRFPFDGTIERQIQEIPG